MNKGQQTRETILECAMRFISQHGIATISIGEMAKLLGMSRTGVISHFNNKQNMQIAILQHCEKVFLEEVLKPAYHPSPLAYLQRFLHNWINWVYRLTGKQHMSCPFVKAVAEFQDKPDCPVRDLLASQQRRTQDFLRQLIQQCVDANQLKNSTHSEAMMQDIYAFYLNHNITKHLLKDPLADARFEQRISTLIESNLAAECQYDD